MLPARSIPAPGPQPRWSRRSFKTLNGYNPTNLFKSIPGEMSKQNQACLPSLLPFIFRARTWTGRGGGGAIRKSTGWDLSLPQRNQMGFRKERRKACGLRPFLLKNQRLVVLRSVALPPRPGEALELLEPFLFLKSEGGQENQDLKSHRRPRARFRVLSPDKSKHMKEAREKNIDAGDDVP